MKGTKVGNRNIVSMAGGVLFFLSALFTRRDNMSIFLIRVAVFLLIGVLVNVMAYKNTRALNVVVLLFGLGLAALCTLIFTYRQLTLSALTTSDVIALIILCVSGYACLVGSIIGLSRKKPATRIDFDSIE